MISRKILLLICLAFASHSAWSEVVSAEKTNNFQLKVGISGVSTDAHIQFFLDVDNDPDTGYFNYSGVAGADYVIEDQQIMKFQAADTSSDWGDWTVLSDTVSTTFSTNSIDARVALSVLLGVESTIKLAVVIIDSNWNVVGNPYPASGMKTITFEENSPLSPFLSVGFDWSLPSYATKSPNGGMIGEGYNNDPATKGSFMEVLWKHSEPIQGQYDFSYFEQRLDQVNEGVLVRLEVNSKCHMPDWASIPHLSNQSLQFWKPQYISQLRGFINEFATRYKDNPKIIGVHLGIADGEYYQDTDGDGVYDQSACPSGNDFDSIIHGSGRDGWGEFWVNESLNESTISIANGLTPQNFESSVKNIINLYTGAFGTANVGKLAFTNFASFGQPEFDAKMPSIIDYVMSKGLGNREGEIEAWMRYTGHVYGANFVTGNNTDSSCSMTFDEGFADQIAGRYWGDENEFYGNKPWVVTSPGSPNSGPLSNQAYRFYVSSMRALQLRRNYFSVDLIANTYFQNTNDQYEYQFTGSGNYDSLLLTKYHSGDFLTYLSKTLGRTRSDTPDAFVVLGERTLDTSFGLYPSEYKMGNTSEQCLIDGGNRGYTTVNEFGRWLSVVSPTTADQTMRKNMPESEGYWGLNMIADRGNEQHYELYARKSNELLFDINDQLIQERCANGCNIEVKVVFKDDRAMNLQVTSANASRTLASLGGGQTRTATFPISGKFANGYNGADFSVKTADGSEISVLMTRINILKPIRGRKKASLPWLLLLLD